MIKINLLPVRAAQKKERLRAQMSVFFLCLILVFIACGALYFQKQAAIASVQADIKDTEQRNKDLQKELGELRNLEQKKKALDSQLAVLKKLKDDKSGPVHSLDELSTALPENLWLTSFKENDGKIVLSGVADLENTVASFMNRLEDSPYYKQVELKVLERTNIAKQKMQKFTLNCSTESPLSK